MPGGVMPKNFRISKVGKGKAKIYSEEEVPLYVTDSFSKIPQAPPYRLKKIDLYSLVIHKFALLNRLQSPDLTR